VVAQAASLALAVPAPSSSVEFTCVGECEPGGPERTTRGGAVLMGGSTDVPAAFEWLSRQADGGDILVLRATGTGAYNQFIYDMGLCRSAATLVISDPDGANDEFVIDRINAANGIFFAGGNQWNYIGGWWGSRLQAAVQAAIDERSVPVGGTSAGEAIMTEHVFTAEVRRTNTLTASQHLTQSNYLHPFLSLSVLSRVCLVLPLSGRCVSCTVQNGGVTSAEALADPFDERVALSTAPFLRVPFLQGAIADQHFRERDRIGRSLSFMARVSQQRAAAGQGYESRCAFCHQQHPFLRLLLLGNRKPIARFSLRCCGAQNPARSCCWFY
jgi:cyanophycinase-like exopeptidase